MADPSDYTQMWSGVFTPPPAPGGVSILDDDDSVRLDDVSRLTPCGRTLYEEAHPRAVRDRQRYPGPFGAGRASDRVGPSLKGACPSEGRLREGFAAGAPSFEDWPGGPGHAKLFEARPSDEQQAEDAYLRGSRALGHPGFRGMVTSRRGRRAAVDGVAWDNRPPHFAPGSPNSLAHLYLDPAARGPALFSKDPVFPGFRQVDRFAAGSGPPAAGSSPLMGAPCCASAGPPAAAAFFWVLLVFAAVCFFSAAAARASPPRAVIISAKNSDAAAEVARAFREALNATPR
jgi:hypothetical protein